MIQDIHAHADLAFPTSLPAFQRLFPNDAACAAYLDKDRNIIVTRGCFIGTLAQFADAVKKTHKNNKVAREYATLIQFIKLRLAQPKEKP